MRKRKASHWHYETLHYGRFTGPNSQIYGRPVDLVDAVSKDHDRYYQWVQEWYGVNPITHYCPGDDIFIKRWKWAQKKMSHDKDAVVAAQIAIETFSAKKHVAPNLPKRKEHPTEPEWRQNERLIQYNRGFEQDRNRVRSPSPEMPPEPSGEQYDYEDHYENQKNMSNNLQAGVVKPYFTGSAFPKRKRKHNLAKEVAKIMNEPVIYTFNTQCNWETEVERNLVCETAVGNSLRNSGGRLTSYYDISHFADYYNLTRPVYQQGDYHYLNSDAFRTSTPYWVLKGSRYGKVVNTGNVGITVEIVYWKADANLQHFKNPIWFWNEYMSSGGVFENNWNYRNPQNNGATQTFDMFDPIAPPGTGGTFWTYCPEGALGYSHTKNIQPLKEKPMVRAIEKFFTLTKKECFKLGPGDTAQFEMHLGGPFLFTPNDYQEETFSEACYTPAGDGTDTKNLIMRGITSGAFLMVRTTEVAWHTNDEGTTRPTRQTGFGSPIGQFAVTLKDTYKFAPKLEVRQGQLLDNQRFAPMFGTGFKPAILDEYAKTGYIPAGASARAGNVIPDIEGQLDDQHAQS